MIGWLVAKFLAKLVGKVRTRVGFDRLVERGGIKTALERSSMDASDIVAKIVYYAILLIALQIAFGVWGPNPVSDLLTAIVAWLPRAIAAIVIVVVAAAVAAAVKNLIRATLSGLSYGRVLGTIASVFILALGVIAALDQVGIATTVTTPVPITVLATAGGIAVVGVGGGLIGPMRSRWEHWLNKAEHEIPKMREHADAQGGTSGQARRQAEQTHAQSARAATPAGPAQGHAAATPPTSPIRAAGPAPGSREDGTTYLRAEGHFQQAPPEQDERPTRLADRSPARGVRVRNRPTRARTPLPASRGRVLARDGPSGYAHTTTGSLPSNADGRLLALGRPKYRRSPARRADRNPRVTGWRKEASRHHACGSQGGTDRGSGRRGGLGRRRVVELHGRHLRRGDHARRRPLRHLGRQPRPRRTAVRERLAVVAARRGRRRRPARHGGLRDLHLERAPPSLTACRSGAGIRDLDRPGSAAGSGSSSRKSRCPARLGSLRQVRAAWIRGSSPTWPRCTTRSPGRRVRCGPRRPRQRDRQC
ncbi:mechanosensitive ion channel family protein [Amycolatopsis australiensis]|uniref:mechanosensitive ion channel family protein n=1 Tax=Amycolatopsis australiensis TaxID=546364 RepID=UPI00092FF656